MNYMGIDIGTSGCKAGIFDKNGQMLVIAKQSYDVIFTKDGGAELDSDEVIDKCFDVIKECTSRINSNSIKGISITSQGEAFTAVGSENETLCNAMVSSDTRAEPYIPQLIETIDEKKLYRITGHTVHPMFTVFKLLWLKKNRPEVWKQVQYLLCFEDLLQLRLGVVNPAISWSLAGRTMMFDVEKQVWSTEILKEVGLTSSHLARPLPSGSIVGCIGKTKAGELGLSDDVVVVTGGHDQTCSALGAGVTEEGVAMIATGTVECITPAFKNPIFSDKLRKNNLCTYNYTIKDTYTTAAYSLTGGNILKWFADEFAAEETVAARQMECDRYELILKNMCSKPTNLMVLPYFTSSGTPYFDTKTKGAIFGLRLSTKRGEIIRALLEGVAFEMRLNLEILQASGYKINELRAVGGGAKSADWMQLKANVMDKKITTLNITEAGCYGAAMLACSGFTGKSITTLAPTWVKPLRALYPESKSRKWYSERYKLYKKLYSTVKSISF